MTFVITPTCCNDASCVPVCPVQCIRPRPGDADFDTAEQLYIDPTLCIDCAACQEECPVGAIYPEFELPAPLADLLAVNAEYFQTRPVEESARPDPEHHVLPVGRASLRVAVVGAGPAGCYTADELSRIAGASVTLLERLPTPFGLVRAGVAPDHPDTKQITGLFGSVLARPNVSCYFNVDVGADVMVAELLRSHHAVVWAGGASTDRTLDVPGADHVDCVPAREVVAWYNGHPDHARSAPRLDGGPVVVIGNGNVALDIARILVQPVEALRRTDISDSAVDALARGRTTDVVVVARRGPEHAACTSGEVAALQQVAGAVVLADPGEVAGLAQATDRTARHFHAASLRSRADAEKAITFRFGLTPVSVDVDEQSRIRAVTFRRSDGGAETIAASLVVLAVGYRGRPVPGLPFDEGTGTVPNDGGRVLDADAGGAVPGVYCSGWIKRGATGTIGTNRFDARQTVAALLEDFAEGRLAEPVEEVVGLAERLAGRGVSVVDKDAWVRIDKAERAAGAAQGRPRVKLTSREGLLAAGAGPAMT